MTKAQAPSDPLTSRISKILERLWERPAILGWIVLITIILMVEKFNISIPGFLLFVLCVFSPRILEQMAYTRFVGSPTARAHRKSAKVVRDYGVAYIWDLALFLVLLGAGFRFVGSAQLLATWEWIGCTLFLIGVITRILALRELGVYYDAIISVQAEHKIISSGPYRLMRHPLHFGIMLQTLGLAFLNPIWVGLPAALAAIAVSWYSDRYEDKVLLRELGPAYGNYYAQTWDMIDLILRKLPTTQPKQ